MYLKLAEGKEYFIALDGSIFGEVVFLCALAVILALVIKKKRGKNAE